MSAKDHVLIAGGGVAALEAALALRDLAAGRVTVELLAPEPRFWYRPLAVAEPFKLGDVTHYELDPLARRIGATFTPGALTGVDAWRQIAYTSKNTEIPYDQLLVACGALPTPAIAGAMLFRGPADTHMIEGLLSDLVARVARSVAFVVPWGAVWSLPAYELALLTASYLEKHDVHRVEIYVVTPEERPLQVFGKEASEAMQRLLFERGVLLETGRFSSEVVDRDLRLIPDGRIGADRFVALPRLRGAPIDGLPQTIDGFVPVDTHCRVEGMRNVYAAGDITNFMIKQGGIAAQQAEVAAQSIAAACGCDVVPDRFRPVLRGLLLTGREARYLRRELRGESGQEMATVEPLWWPPSKIVGRYVAPFLASLESAEMRELPEAEAGVLPVLVELDPRLDAELSPERIASELDQGAEHVEAWMSDPVVVAPEDTLGEVAERLLERGQDAAVVVEYGRLVGVLTQHDLLRAARARVHPSEARVRQWMTAEPVTVSAGAYTNVATLLMREYGIHHLVVVEGERPVGLLHLDDIPQDVPLAIGLGF